MKNLAEIQLKVSNLGIRGKIVFYLRFAHALTAAARAVQLNSELDERERLEALKVLNEIQHRVISQLFSLHNGAPEMADCELLSIANCYAIEHRAIKRQIDWSLQCAIKDELDGDPHS